MSTVPEVERDAAGMQATPPCSVIWAWTPRLMPTPLTSWPEQGSGRQPALVMTGLGTGTLESLRRLQGNKWCIWPTIPLLKVTPRDVPWEAHWLPFYETLDLQRLSHSRPIDRIRHCLADLMVSSPWIYVAGRGDAKHSHYLAEVTRPYRKQGQDWEAEAELRGSPIFYCVISEENGEDEMGVWTPRRMAGERRASSMNPESEQGNSLYGDCQMWAVAETSWERLKAQLLYTPAMDIEHVRRGIGPGTVGGRYQNEQGRFSAFQQPTQFLCCKAILTETQSSVGENRSF